MYAPSTVAMTAYNLIASARKPMAPDALFSMCEQVQLPKLTKDIFDMGMNGLIARGRAKMVKGEVAITDPQNRVIKERDRSDAFDTDEDGIPTGGWNGWLVQCCSGQLIPMENGR